MFERLSFIYPALDGISIAGLMNDYQDDKSPIKDDVVSRVITGCLSVHFLIMQVSQWEEARGRALLSNRIKVFIRFLPVLVGLADYFYLNRKFAGKNEVKGEIKGRCDFLLSDRFAATCRIVNIFVCLALFQMGKKMYAAAFLSVKAVDYFGSCRFLSKKTGDIYEKIVDIGGYANMILSNDGISVVKIIYGAALVNDIVELFNIIITKKVQDSFEMNPISSDQFQVFKGRKKRCFRLVFQHNQFKLSIKI